MMKARPIVLLLEDDPDLAQELTEFLADHAIVAMAAANRAAAEALAAREKIGVLVVDLNLALENGLAAAAALIEQHRGMGKELAVIVYSGRAPHSSELSELAFAPVGVLNKSCDLQDFLKLVRHALNKV